MDVSDEEEEEEKVEEVSPKKKKKKSQGMSTYDSDKLKVGFSRIQTKVSGKERIFRVTHKI